MTKERGPERPRESWMLIRRFADTDAALQAYESARDLLVVDELDASVLRLMVNGTSFVTVIGEEPLANDATEHMYAALGSGLAAALPDPVVAQLRRRRHVFKATGLGYLERRSGP